MTLMQMKYAIAVADTKSMNEAARSLFITQPSLSASIKELENEIGVELFKRTNRGITVTPEGEEFLGYARQVVEQYRLIESKYIEKRKCAQESSVCLCSIIPLLSRPLWKWCVSLEWTSMNLQFMRPRPTK